MPPRMRTQSAGRPAAESLRGERAEMTKEEELIRGVEGVNRNVEGVNGRAPDFSTIIAQQLQNLLPAMLAQVGNQGCGITPWSGLAMLRIVIATERKIMQKAVQIFVALTDEAVRNRSIKKVEKIGNMGEPIKDKNGRYDNNRTRTGNAFATTTNPVGRENTSA
ncbi:hypothetical protein Tco_1418304 [Tanacetum coccineum]